MEGVEHATGGGSGASAANGSSLIRAKNLAKAISAISRKSGEVLELRLEPATAKFQVRRGSSGSAQGWVYTSGGDVNSFGVTLIGPGRIQDNVFPIAQLKATTPEKIVAAIHARDASLSLKDVQFMTLDLDASSGKFIWSVNIGARVGLALPGQPQRRRRRAARRGRFQGRLARVRQAVDDADQRPGCRRQGPARGEVHPARGRRRGEDPGLHEVGDPSAPSRPRLARVSSR